jgi:hypothetical protein
MEKSKELQIERTGTGELYGRYHQELEYFMGGTIRNWGTLWEVPSGTGVLYGRYHQELENFTGGTIRNWGMS